MFDRTPCASGAHFRGNCRCIGERGLRHKDEDESMGVKRDWDWYYQIYKDDDYMKAYELLHPGWYK